MRGSSTRAASELIRCEWRVQSDIDNGKRTDGELRLLLREEREEEEQEGGRSREECLMWA